MIASEAIHKTDDVYRESLTGVWGQDALEVYAVGVNGTLLRFVPAAMEH